MRIHPSYALSLFSYSVSQMVKTLICCLVEGAVYTGIFYLMFALIFWSWWPDSALDQEMAAFLLRITLLTTTGVVWWKKPDHELPYGGQVQPDGYPFPGEYVSFQTKLADRCDEQQEQLDVLNLKNIEVGLAVDETIKGLKKISTALQVLNRSVVGGTFKETGVVALLKFENDRTESMIAELEKCR